MSTPRPRWATPALLFGFWTLVALAFATSSYAGYAVKGDPIPVREAAWWAFTEWYLWGLLAVPVVALARRVPLGRGTWQRALALHLPLFAAVYVIWVAGYVSLERASGFTTGMPDLWGTHAALYLSKKWAFAALLYAVMVGAAHAIELARRSREREQRTAQLEAQLARTQLEVLRSQLQPHFLFNTLHTVTALMQRDVAAAERVMARLSDLLRMSLQSSSRAEVTLRHELEFLEHYLEIQRTRFQDRLRVSVEASPATLDALVPNLILQPLVENAIKHAVEPHAGAERIAVRAWRENGSLALEVSDDGPGFSGARRSGNGIGLANTGERLRQLYGEGQRFELGTGPEGGARVLIEIPWKTESKS